MTAFPWIGAKVGRQAFAGFIRDQRELLLPDISGQTTFSSATAAREIVLVIHWKGDQHSELRLRKPQSGGHDCSTPDDALGVIRSMAARWSDEDIAATLNRMRLPTGQGKTWTAHRVGSIRRVRGIHAYLSAEKDGTWLAERNRERSASALRKRAVGTNRACLRKDRQGHPVLRGATRRLGS